MVIVPALKNPLNLRGLVLLLWWIWQLLPRMMRLRVVIPTVLQKSGLLQNKGWLNSLGVERLRKLLKAITPKLMFLNLLIPKPLSPWLVVWRLQRRTTTFCPTMCHNYAWWCLTYIFHWFSRMFLTVCPFILRLFWSAVRNLSVDVSPTPVHCSWYFYKGKHCS